MARQSKSVHGRSKNIRARHGRQRPHGAGAQVGRSSCLEVLEHRTLMAGQVYRTSIDPGFDPFEVYNTSSDQWQTLAPVDTGAEMAVSAAGDLFMVNYT